MLKNSNAVCQKFAAKRKDDVICYIGVEVVLCQ